MVVPWPSGLGRIVLKARSKLRTAFYPTYTERPPEHSHPMFDLGTTKLLLLGIIALLVVGPKELPGMLRTIGRYVGMMKRQAAEFRTQFDEAMKESELADLKQQVQDIGREAKSAVDEMQTTLTKEAESVQAEANKTLAAIDTEANAMAAEAQAPAVSGEPAPTAAFEPAVTPTVVAHAEAKLPERV